MQELPPWVANPCHVVWRRRRGDEVTARPLSLVTTTDRRPDGLLASVTADLTASDTGIEFVYRSLARLRERTKADDVLVIVDEPPLGRQVFRADRAPVDSTWARELIRTGEPGVHATPVDIEPAVAASVASLCSIAVRLDVARHDSLHDGLTGVLNRRAFDDLLESSCARSERYGWNMTIVLLDVDHFKSVNDRLGHAAGDSVLQVVASELRTRLRVGDAAARIGGDEFGLLLPNADAQAVGPLVKRIEAALHDAVPSAAVTLSAGAATAPDDGSDPRQLFRVADRRLYEVKPR